MVLALRVSLASILVPISMLAAFFVCYAVLYPAFWVANVALAGKAFQVGTSIIAAATTYLLWQRARVERHPWIAALLLIFGFIIIVSAVAASFKALGRF